MSDTTPNPAAISPAEKLGIGSAPISAVHDLLDVVWGMEKKMTVCLIGDTGIGKTPVVHQWVKRRGGFLKTLSFAHMQPEDVSMCMFNEDGTRFDFVPHAFLLELNEQAEKLGCAVLFIDEWNRGDKNLVNQLFTLTDERRIHDFHLHPNVLVVAAMNPSDGTYLVNEAERDHAVRKRLCFVYTVPEVSGWLKHAKEADYHPLVIDFVRAMGQFFYDNSARDAGKAFACPSSWEKVSNVLKAADAAKRSLTGSAVRILLEGQIGFTAASAFLDFVADQSTVIQPKDVLEHYDQGGRARVARLSGAFIDKATQRFEPDPAIGTMRLDVLTALNRSLALTIFSEQPDPGAIGQNLATYLLDLPNELYQAFWSQQMKAEMPQTAAARQYVSELNAALKAVPGYSERVRQVLLNQRKVSDELRGVGA